MGKLVCGGAERALFDLISLMDKSRFDIQILVQHAGGEWEDKFRNAGIAVVHPFERRKKDGSLITFVRHQVKKLRMKHCIRNRNTGMVDMLFPQGVDIVVDYSSWDGGRIAFGKNAKTVKFIHGDVGDNPDFLDVMLQIRDVLPDYDKIICVSDKSFRSFCRAFDITQGVEHHYNPINSDVIRTMAEEYAPDPELGSYVCAVGRLAAEKGFDRLIYIHKQILDQGMIHRLVIVGDGAERERLRQIIRETGTEDTVLMTGYQSNPYPYMKNSRFLVCSSYTEGLPVIAMEALVLGVPVVSAAPSVREVFGDESCGMITGNDDDSLKEGVIRLLTDDALYAQLKQGAENRSVCFNGKHMVRELEDVFETLAAN